MAKCPNCEAVVRWDEPRCERCSANFAGPQSWRPLPETPAEAAPHAFDDHVVVGGYYFDIQDTAYTLTPTAAGTQLKVSMGYRVTTQFNWYADAWARLLLGNFEEVVLDFYRRRSENQAARLKSADG